MRVGTSELKSASGSSRFAAILSRERLIAGCVAFLSLGFFLFLALRGFEHAVTFHPLRYDDRTGWKQPTSAQDVWLKTTDGVRLHGWLFETRERPAFATIIFFHGNGGNISSVGWVGETSCRVEDSMCCYWTIAGMVGARETLTARQACTLMPTQLMSTSQRLVVPVRQASCCMVNPLGQQLQWIWLRARSLEP